MDTGTEDTIDDIHICSMAGHMTGVPRGTDVCSPGTEYTMEIAALYNFKCCKLKIMHARI